ncbi:MAG: histidine phosphatase family protein [Gammaproteobacteria bacterium]|nr:histidine phosphatase family protein [Gammaproteobacteria bacterium]
MSVYLLRHGETTLTGRFVGRVDPALSEKGWRSMRLALSDLPRVSRVVSSPLRRCLDFAQAWAVEAGLPMAIDDRLAEMDFGAWEGRSAAEIHAADADALGRFWNDPYAGGPDGSEPFADFIARVEAGFADAEAGTDEVLVVSHGGPIRWRLARAQGLPPERLLEVVCPLASLHRPGDGSC